MSRDPVATATPPLSEVYLRDELAERLSRRTGEIPEAAQLLAELGDSARQGHPPRIAVRGLTGSARGLLASWLQRETGRTVLYLVPHGDAFEEARDDLEYFRGAGATLAVPRARQPSLRSRRRRIPGITAQRLETLARLARGETRRRARHGARAAAARAAPRAARARGARRSASATSSIPPSSCERLVVHGLRAAARGRGGRPLRAARRHPRRLPGRARRSAPARVRRRHARLAAPLRRRHAALARAAAERDRAAALRGGGRCPTRPRPWPSGCAPRPADAKAGLPAARTATERDQRPVPRRHGALRRRTTTRISARCSTTCPDDTLVVRDDPGKLARARRGARATRSRAATTRRARTIPAISPPERAVPAAARRSIDAARRRARAPTGWAPVAGGRRGRGATRRRCFVDCTPAEPMQRSIERLKTHLAELGANGIQRGDPVRQPGPARPAVRAARRHRRDARRRPRLRRASRSRRRARDPHRPRDLRALPPAPAAPQAHRRPLARRALGAQARRLRRARGPRHRRLPRAEAPHA